MLRYLGTEVFPLIITNQTAVGSEAERSGRRPEEVPGPAATPEVSM